MSNKKLKYASIPVLVATFACVGLAGAVVAAENPIPEEISFISGMEKEIFLTIDAESNDFSAREILNSLDKYGAKASFFLNGQWAEKYQSLAKEIADKGHDIFNHSYSHPYMTQLSDDEIRQELEKTDSVIKSITGVSTKPYFRAPYGDRDTRVLAAASEAGFQSIRWSIASWDWKESLGFTAEEAKERMLSALTPGSIHLIHTGNTISGKIIEDVMDEIYERGYKVAPLSSVLAKKPDDESKVVPQEISQVKTDKKQVVLTFDSGGGNGDSTQKILEALKKHNIKADFFLGGDWARWNKKMAKQIAKAGHDIYSHTNTHKYLTQLSDLEIKKEIKKADTAIYKTTGVSPKPYFRAPYGDRDSRVLKIAADAGYQSVLWSVSSWDWKESDGYTAEECKERMLDNLKPGNIYLMHLNTNISGEIIEDVITEIENQGYEIVTTEEGLK